MTDQPQKKSILKRIPLHWQIIGGMILGIVIGVIAVQIDLARNATTGKDFIVAWLKPFGTIFINSLKLVAIPLIITSLIKGISDLNEISNLSSLGLRTVGLYLLTTVVAVTVGLTLVNVVQPGNSISAETKSLLQANLSTKDEAKMESAKLEAANQKAKGPLQPLVDLVPGNIFSASTANKNMLQVIFFVVLFGIGLLTIPDENSAPVKKFFDGLNDVILKLIDFIMMVAPLGVLALLAALIVEAPSADVFVALLWYSLCVVGGLAILVFAVYPTAVFVFARTSFTKFFRGISPAQLLAFSTSSSAATLPVTMDCVEENLGVQKEVSSFVLPIGATVNMDGTSLYQAVAAVFIAQVYDQDLSLAQQLTIVLTATLASIGSAAVPGAGLVMLVIVLGAINVPVEGIAFIFAVDRILDMCRTTVNVTGDATVSMLVARSVGKLRESNLVDGVEPPPEKDALAIWQEKLGHLQRALAKSSDAEQKFSIEKRIEDTRTKIAELDGN